MLQRALDLSDRLDVNLVADLARTLDRVRDFLTLLDGAAVRADADGDAAGSALARAMAAYGRLWTMEGTADEQERLALEALRLLEAAEDHEGLAHLWFSLSNGVYVFRCQWAQVEHAAEQQRRHSELAGRSRQRTRLGFALIYGPRPVAEALPTVTALAAANPHPWTLLDHAVLLAMDDRIEEARTVAKATHDHLSELGIEREVRARLAEIELIAGDDEAAAEHLEFFCATHRTGQPSAALSTELLTLGRTLCRLGRFEEAEQLAAEGRIVFEDDRLTEALLLQVTALLQVQRQDHAEAERLAREAVATMQTTDAAWSQADTLYDLGEVLAAAGCSEAAAASFQEALVVYDRKGMIPLARRTRERLATLKTAR